MSQASVVFAHFSNYTEKDSCKYILRAHVQLRATRDNILCVRGLETAPDTTKVHKTIIVILCCAGKSRQPNSTKPFCCVQTKLKSFSNWENHNRKLESVCPRYKRSENHNWYARLSQFFTKRVSILSRRFMPPHVIRVGGACIAHA